MKVELLSENRVNGKKIYCSGLWSLILAIVLFFLQWLLFRNCFRHFVGYSYPIGWDQLGVYLRIYELSVNYQHAGWQIFGSENAWLFDKASMKGFISPLVGLMLIGIFGFKHLVAQSVNLFWLIVAESTLFLALRKRFGIVTVLAAIGFFLLSSYQYMNIGGLFDLRLDYGGMATFGLTTFCLWKYLECGKHWLFAVFVCLLMSTFTRSITIFYLTGTLMLMFAISALIYGSKFTSAYWKILASRLLQALCAAIATLSIFLVMFWKPFYSYYLKRALRGETAQWRESFGAHNLMDVIAFNFNSFCQIYGWHLFFFSLSICAVILSRQKPLKIMEGHHALYFLAVCSILSTFGIICCWSPTPFGLGVLTVTVSLALAVFNAEHLGRTKFYKILSIAVFIAGISNFLWHLELPPHSYAPSHAEAEVIKNVNTDLISRIDYDSKIRIAYPLQTEGLHPLTLNLQWFETKQRQMPANVELPYFSVSSSNDTRSLSQFVSNASVVVLPIYLSKDCRPIFAALGEGAVFDALPQLQQELHKTFRKEEVFADKTGSFSVVVYSR